MERKLLQAAVVITGFAKVSLERPSVSFVTTLLPVPRLRQRRVADDSQRSAVTW